MTSRGRYTPLTSEMYTLYLESKIAHPLFGNVIVEVSPSDSARTIVDNYLHALQSEEKPNLAIYNVNNEKLDWNATLESQGICEGARLFIGSERSNIKPFHVAIIGVSTILIAATVFIVTALLYSTTGGTIPFDYGIVIDGGSSHTEVFLYHWSGEKEKGTGNAYQIGSCEYEVGIASGVDPINIVACVNNVSSLVPKDSLPVLYLGATAGMRILNLTNPKEASLILTSLKYALSTTSAQVKTISIIPGESEALFSWISTNFLFHTLYTNKKQGTYGALDLGGASTQYAYAVYNKSSVNDSDIVPLKLYGEEYFVKSETFLCFGYIEALYRNEASMFMEIETATLNDPCLPSGYVEKMDVHSFAEKPCVKSSNFDNWIKKYSISGELLVRGGSNYEHCKKNVLNLINQTYCKNSGFTQCLPDTNLRGLGMNFTAFSGFYYVVHFLNGTESLDKFVNVTKEWCSFSWEHIQHSVPKAELKHVLQYCFAGVYISELLIKKYGFDSDSWNSIYFTKEIENTDIGWTLGYMIDATNAIPEELPIPPVISLTIFILLALLSFVMIIIALIIIKKHGSMQLFSHTRLL